MIEQNATTRVTFLRLLIAVMLLVCTTDQVRAITLFLDRGDLASGVQGGPMDNTNPVIEITPGQMLTLHLWALPESDGENFVCSLGHDITAAGTAAGEITVIGYTSANPAMGSANRWTGTLLKGGLNTNGNLVDDQRAVYLPVAVPFEGGLSSAHLPGDPGLDPNGTGAIYVGQLDLVIGKNAKLGTSAELRFSVSSLLITHINQSSQGDEPIFFGFDGSGPEPATGNGSTPGTTSVMADATIVISCSRASPHQIDKNNDGVGDVCQLIPAVSTWGMVALLLLVMTTGTVILKRRTMIAQERMGR